MTRKTETQLYGLLGNISRIFDCDRKITGYGLISRSYQHRSKRLYATSPDKHIGWPESKNPSPYDILNLDPKDFSAKVLKKNFRLLAKQYHPDMDPTHKDGTKFRLLVAAYNLLRDPTQKTMYDQYSYGWEGVHSGTRPTSSSQNEAEKYKGQEHKYYSYSHRYPFDDTDFHYTGSWQDYANYKHRKENPRDPYLTLKTSVVCLTLISIGYGWQYLNFYLFNEIPIMRATDSEIQARRNRDLLNDLYPPVDIDSQIEQFKFRRQMNDKLSRISED